MELAAYRTAAEAFTAELMTEYYRHYSGLQDEFAIEAIYDHHADLFSRKAVDELRELAGVEDDGDEGRSRRALFAFAIEGLLGGATKDLDAEIAQREAELQIEVDGVPIGFRESAVIQQNEPDGEHRALIEAARLEATERELTPLHREALERSHALARELGWPSYLAMCEEVQRIDLAALERQTAAFAAATEAVYPAIVDPPVRRAVGVGLDELRRSDLPWFFRAESADVHFPQDRLVASFVETMAGLGIELDAQRNVTLDVEQRPRKSPRAFCAAVRVPTEIYLVVPPVGGRDDFVALFHEGGHAQHFAHVDPALRWEFRALGDNAITEAFAFLFDHLVEDPEWLRRRLGVEDPDGALGAHSRAQLLVYLRRYGAKLAYELELHANGRPADELAATYASRLSEAVKVDWPAETFLTDVDPGFYAASYLRAWALETHLRAALRERFGAAWFEEPAAGDWLKALWRDGQRLRAEELLEQVGDAELDFAALLADLGLAG